MTYGQANENCSGRHEETCPGARDDRDLSVEQKPESPAARRAPPRSRVVKKKDARLSPERAFDQGAAVADAAAFPGLCAGRANEPELLAAHEGRIPGPRIRHGALRGRACLTNKLSV
jgi:hypothetical protein